MRSTRSQLLSRLLAIFLCALLTPLLAQSSSDDYTGMYSFLKDGESIQLNVQNGQLSGWVTSFGLLDSDKDILMDHTFQKAELHGDQIHFITKPLHGCWFEFSGSIHRGEAASRAKEGYYEIAGQLTEFVTNDQNQVSARQRQATFKSQPQSDSGGQ
jgi:hypothetical protein